MFSTLPLERRQKTLRTPAAPATPTHDNRGADMNGPGASIVLEALRIRRNHAESEVPA
jgi:hypothetical protein